MQLLKQSLKLTSTLALMVLSLQGGLAFGSEIQAELAEDELAKVIAGESVTVTEDIEPSVWPKITVYRRSPFAPEELMAVFWDFSRHKEFFDGVAESKVAQVIKPNELIVDYTMRFPTVLGISVPDENYAARDVLSTYMGGKAYRCNWVKHRADTIRNLSGSFRVEPYEGGGSILAYTNFIEPPKPTLARILVKVAIQRVNQAGVGISTRVQQQKKSQPELLSAQLEALKKALGR